uniref:Uncharacterized protein n=1 Tax=Cavia porcellus TaxID=10141 RepID=H0W3S6_CAVPO
MAGRVLQKLDVLEGQAKTLLRQRAKKNRLQNVEIGKTLVTPLTFDFRLEFEEATAVPTHKPASQTTADKLCDSKKPKRFISLRREPGPIKSNFEKCNLRPHIVTLDIRNQETPEVEENLKSRSRRPFLYLKDTSEAKHSQHRQGLQRSLRSFLFSPALSNQSHAYEKEKDSTTFIGQRDNKTSKSWHSTGHLEDSGNERRMCPPSASDLRSEENQSAPKDRASTCGSVAKRSLLPLCFEDELRNPNAKVIQVQDDRKPIIFHESQYVQTLLLTKNRFSTHILENEKIHPCKRTNFVLERNCATLKSLDNGAFITLSRPQKTTHTAGRRDGQAKSHETGHRTIKSKLRRKTKDQTPGTGSWSTPHGLPQTLFSPTEKAAANLGVKTGIQERRTAAAKLGGTFSTRKPGSPHKFNAFPPASHLKPLRHKLDLRKLHNATPLDNLLTLAKGKLSGSQDTVYPAILA